MNCRVYERNVQARNVYVAHYNIECYKCHNYWHIAHDCRSIMKSTMKENTDIMCKKVWRRKQKQEEQVNEELQEIILTGFAKVEDHDESTGKDEDVRTHNDDPIAEQFHPFL